MKIGYACLTAGVNSLGSYRTCSVKTYNETLITKIIANNLDVLQKTLEYNVSNHILMFRISSDIIPLASHPINTFDWKTHFKNKLTEVGNYIRKHQIRVSMHPGQYTVLNSPNSDVVLRAIEDLNYHADFLDMLGVDQSHKLILHIGGGYNDKELAMERFAKNYHTLDEKIKRRLVIENDDRIYTICDALKLSKQLSIPVVFDNLHHYTNNCEELTDSEAIKLASLTWNIEDGTQKIHYSQQDLDKRAGAHSQFIAIEPFTAFKGKLTDIDVDIMLEVKDKNLSAIKCNLCSENYQVKYYLNQWAKYKYVILERNHNVYKQIRTYVSTTKQFDSHDFYKLIESGLESKPSIGSYTNGFDHVWGYFKKQATALEKRTYQNKLAKFRAGKLKPQSLKNYLYKLAVKYDQEYLLTSYYFYY